MKAAPAHRQQLALDLLLKGTSASSAVAHLTQHCSISRRQAQRNVREAYQLLKADIDACAIDRPVMVAKLIHVLETTAERALEAKQFNSVVNASRELRELLGLSADK